MLDIASTALDHNARHGITGYLYYDVTVFIQEIEGIRSDVEALYASIVRDDRHEGIRTIMTQDAETRVFGEWTMAFHNGDDDGNLLRNHFGERVPDCLTAERGEEVLRFLRGLSMGGAPLEKLAATGPLLGA